IQSQSRNWKVIMPLNLPADFLKSILLVDM
ncbi:uncharacterized protein METZ01_LOCUS500280, partial [marine metagenome]